MSDFQIHRTNADSFSGRNSFSPFDEQLSRAPALTYIETIDLWAHATLLFHNFEWEQALSAHRRILRQCGTDIKRGYLWFNIGVIRATLGEYYLAAEAFAKAVKHEPESAVGWFCLGISLFELNSFRSATKAFDRGLRPFAADESLDYYEEGLDFVLERTRVGWNCRQALLEKEHKKAGASLSLEGHLALNRMPAGRLFEPPSFGDDTELETDNLTASSPKPSPEPRSTSSGSGKLRRGIQTLLSRQPKQSARFEHSNARLQALEEITSSDSEIRKEAVVSVLAPSALAVSKTAKNDQSQKLPSKPATWPRSTKPPSPLSFVTTKELSSTHTESRHSESFPAGIRNLSTPQAIPATQPSAAVLYHESPIISTEYIPTTTNFGTFVHTAPIALVQEPPARDAPSSDTPAPLSIPKRPRPPPMRPASQSPTSIYSRPFHSPPEADHDPLPAPPTNPSKPKPKPKPNTAATQTWLDTTFPPPRWDSLPPHLRPARRPSRRQQRRPERHRGSPPPSADQSRAAHTLPPLLGLPEHQRDSVASMDSFAIVGMGRRVARWDEGVGWVNGLGLDAGRRAGPGAGAGSRPERQRGGDGEGAGG